MSTRIKNLILSFSFLPQNFMHLHFLEPQMRTLKILVGILFDWLCGIKAGIKWLITVVLARLPLSPLRFPDGFDITEVLLMCEFSEQLSKLTAGLFKANLFLLFHSFSRLGS
jgi:hypothetical protein